MYRFSLANVEWESFTNPNHYFMLVCWNFNNQEPKLFMERNSRFEGRNDGEHPPRGSRWGHGHPHPNQEDFPNKRRRF